MPTPRENVRMAKRFSGSVDLRVFGIYVILTLGSSCCHVAASDIEYACNYTLTHTNHTKGANASSTATQYVRLSCGDRNNTGESATGGLDSSNSTILWYRVAGGGSRLLDDEEWRISERDMGVTFVCAKETEDGDLEVLCEVTPIEVSATVEVKSSLSSKGTEIFVCSDEGMPGTVDYEWYVDGVYVERLNGSSEKDEGAKGGNDNGRVSAVYSGSVLQVSGLTKDQTGMVVVCNVVSSNGIHVNGSLVYSPPRESSSQSGMTTDKVFLFGLIFAGGAPIVFAVFAAACLLARGGKEKEVELEPKLTVEEQDMTPATQRPSLSRSISTDSPADNGGVGLYRSHSTRSTKEKLGRLSQLVLPPIDGEGSRVSQHIYDEAPHFATSELAISRGGKHSATLPTKTYTNRSSLYRLSADYADVVNSHASGNYENFRMHGTASAKPMVSVYEGNGNVNATLPPAMKL